MYIHYMYIAFPIQKPAVHAYMIKSMNYNSLGCEQPYITYIGLDVKMKVTQSTGRVSEKSVYKKQQKLHVVIIQARVENVHVCTRYTQ